MEERHKKFLNSLADEKIKEIDSWSYNSEFNFNWCKYVIERGFICSQVGLLIDYLKDNDLVNGDLWNKIVSLS